MNPLHLWQRFWQNPVLAYPIGITFLCLVPLLVSLSSQNRYIMDIVVTCVIYMVLALGLNIVVGMAGLLDLGYIAFYAVGAYSVALLTTQFHWPVWAVFPVGALAAGVFGILLGLPTLRLRGDYLAIVTLGFGEIIRIALNNLDSVTNGPQGISGIAKPMFFGLELRHINYLYFIILAVLVFTWFVVKNLENSPIGRAWIAIREDELAAGAMGINTIRMKLLAFAMGASFAGLAGVFFGSKMGFVSPESFTFMESVLIVSMVVLGGLGSMRGVVLGAILITVLPEMARDFSQYRFLIFGVAMILIMLVRPEGLIPDARHARELSKEEPN
jgi:branched-chain amino acid transport system permease protein